MDKIISTVADENIMNGNISESQNLKKGRGIKYTYKVDTELMYTDSSILCKDTIYLQHRMLYTINI